MSRCTNRTTSSTKLKKHTRARTHTACRTTSDPRRSRMTTLLGLIEEYGTDERQQREPTGALTSARGRQKRSERRPRGRHRRLLLSARCHPRPSAPRQNGQTCARRTSCRGGVREIPFRVHFHSSSVSLQVVRTSCMLVFVDFTTSHCDTLLCLERYLYV